MFVVAMVVWSCFEKELLILEVHTEVFTGKSIVFLQNNLRVRLGMVENGEGIDKQGWHEF